jgi:hypothetical protein
MTFKQFLLASSLFIAMGSNVLANEVENRIHSSSNDAEEYNGRVSLSSSDLELTQDGNKQQIVGLHFSSLNIPKNATITKAYLQFEVDETSSEATSLIIHGEKSTHALTFTSSSNNISTRSKTSASVTWNPPAWNSKGEQSDAQQSSDIHTIIQELVNQETWNSNSPMVFIISGNGKRIAKSYDGQASLAPLLHIEFEDNENNDETPIIEPPVNNSSNIIESRINANSDDAEESSTKVSLGSSDLELIQDGNKQQIVGLRFNTLNIPKNANITEAYIQFEVDETSSEATTLTIHGEKVASALTFTSSSANISSRAKTTSLVNWSPLVWNTKGVNYKETQQTSNLHSIVQELVNQNSWSSGNAMAFIITGEGKRIAKSYDGKSTSAPLLHIEYDTNSSTTIIPEDNTTIVPPLSAHTIQVPSDYTTLQDAIENAQDGDTILLAPGIYDNLNEIVILQNNLTIASYYHTTGNESYINNTILRGTGDKEHRIFDGSRTAGASENIKFIGFTVENSGKFVTFTYGNENLVDHCQINGIKRDAISFDTEAGGKVFHCIINKSGDDAIDIDTKLKGNFEFGYNQIIDTHDDGIEIHQWEDPKGKIVNTMHYNIHDNIIRNSGKDGIQLIDFHDKTNREFSITNNTISNCGQVGVGMIYEVSQHEETAFEGTDMKELVVVSGNTFDHNLYHLLGGDNMRVYNNHFSNAIEVAIKRVKGDSIIENNTFSNNVRDFENSNN